MRLPTVMIRMGQRRKTRRQQYAHYSIRTNTAANTGKIDLTVQTIREARRLLGKWVKILDRDLVQNSAQPGKYTNLKPARLDTSMSARWVQTTYAQASEAYNLYLTALESNVRHAITKARLDEHTRTIMYRVNRRHAWYAHDLSLDWVRLSMGELTVPEHERHDVISIPVSADDLRFARRLVKWARRKVRRPDLGKVRAIRLSPQVASIESATNGTTYNYWLRLSTVRRGHPVLLPLAQNRYLSRLARDGKVLNSAQLILTGDNRLMIAPVVEKPVAGPRDSGSSLGVDWGLKCMFTTSDGRRLGVGLLDRLSVWDAELSDYEACLRRHGKSLKKDPYYRRLSDRISSFVKNEVGRILNQLAVEDVRCLVVEDLDFRNGRLSHRLNRILNRAGRGAVRSKFARLTEEYGVTVEKVDPAFTSQECSSCGFVSSGNRRSQSHFKCLCCGHKVNADVNAARNILGRSGDGLPADRSRAGCKITKNALLAAHRYRCPTGRHSSAGGL